MTPDPAADMAAMRELLKVPPRKPPAAAGGGSGEAARRAKLCGRCSESCTQARYSVGCAYHDAAGTGRGRAAGLAAGGARTAVR